MAAGESSLASCASSSYARCLKYGSVDVVPEMMLRAGSAVVEVTVTG